MEGYQTWIDGLRPLIVEFIGYAAAKFWTVSIPAVKDKINVSKVS